MIYPISEIDISYVNLFAPARKLFTTCSPFTYPPEEMSIKYVRSSTPIRNVTVTIDQSRHSRAALFVPVGPERCVTESRDAPVVLVGPERCVTASRDARRPPFVLLRLRGEKHKGKRTGKCTRTKGDAAALPNLCLEQQLD